MHAILDISKMLKKRYILPSLGVPRDMMSYNILDRYQNAFVVPERFCGIINLLIKIQFLVAQIVKTASVWFIL